MTISKNICEVTTTGKDDFIVYSARCNCIGSEHSQNIILELDKNGIFTATFYYPCSLSNYYGDENKLKVFWRRLKFVWEFLKSGYLELEGEFIFTKDGLKDYIKALQEGLKRIEKFKN